MKKTILKLISLFLALVISCSLVLTSCKNADTPSNGEQGSVNTSEGEGGTSPENEPPKPPVIPEGMDEDIVSYVYASVAIDLMSYGYDVFNAVSVTDNVKEYGLAYCDYEEAYDIVGDNKTYISTGFLSFSSSTNSKTSENVSYVIPLDENAIEITDDQYGYIVSFVEEGLPNGHFIANGQYIKYAVADGIINIESYDNISSNYDLSIGKLYDYDKSEFIFIPYDEISSDPIEYISLTENIDSQTIKDNLYSIIEEQEKNGYQIESITIAYISVDALNALKGMLSQDNSLNGYSFDELNNIDFDNATQYLHFNEDGSITIKDLPPLPSMEVKSLLDWLVDGLVLVGAGALAIVSITFLGPAGGVIAAGIIGAGIEYFNQTVIQGKSFSEVNWAKVGIMAVSGALGAVVPCAGTLGFLAAGAVGGLTSAALTAVDGGSWEDILLSAAQGAVTSMVMHGLFSTCFLEGAMVLTKDGFVPIELVTVGTLIASYNTYTEQIEWQPVLKTYVNQSNEFIKVSLSNGSEIVSTSNHPYYEINKKQYIPADELMVGNMLLNVDGQVISVVSVEEYISNDLITVYNISVDKNHNYFIGDGILVHNTCGKYRKATRVDNNDIKVTSSISKKQALERLRNGQDVYASSKKAAKALVKDAFGNSKPYYEIHTSIANAKFHFHDKLHHVFHVFFD